MPSAHYNGPIRLVDHASDKEALDKEIEIVSVVNSVDEQN
jgi:hypothetical protein